MDNDILTIARYLADKCGNGALVIPEQNGEVSVIECGKVKPAWFPADGWQASKVFFTEEDRQWLNVMWNPTESPNQVSDLTPDFVIRKTSR